MADKGTEHIQTGSGSKATRNIAVVVLGLAVLFMLLFLISRINADPADSVQPNPVPTESAPTSSPVPKRSVSVYLLDGTPRLERAGIDVSVYNGMQLFEGDTIDAADADLVITIDNLYFVSLHDGAVLTLDMLTAEMPPVVSADGEYVVRVPLDDSSITVNAVDAAIELDSRDFALVRPDLVFSQQGNIRITADGKSLTVPAESAYVIETGVVAAVQQPPEPWPLYQRCLDQYFAGFDYSTVSDAKAAEAVYSEADSCAEVLGTETRSAAENTRTVPVITTQPAVVTGTPAPTASPTPVQPAILTAAATFITSSDSVSCSWTVTGQVQQNQTVMFSLWEYLEGSTDQLVIDWENATQGQTTAVFGNADAIGLTNQHSYYCKVQLLTGADSAFKQSEKFYYDLSHGLLNVAVPAGAFNGEIEGDGEFHDMDIDDVRVRFFLRQNQPDTANYGKYCIGSDSWSSAQTWIEAPLVVSINHLFLFNKDAFSCHDQGAYEQATFMIQMLNRRTGAILYEHTFPVVLD